MTLKIGYYEPVGASLTSAVTVRIRAVNGDNIKGPWSDAPLDSPFENVLSSSGATWSGNPPTTNTISSNGASWA